MAILSAVYMRIFLPDSIINDNLSTPIISKGKLDGIVNPDEVSDKKMQMFKTMPSIEDMLALLKSRSLKFPSTPSTFSSVLSMPLFFELIKGFSWHQALYFMLLLFDSYLKEYLIMFLNEWQLCAA